jgi:hypothetical protein
LSDYRATLEDAFFPEERGNKHSKGNLSLYSNKFPLIEREFFNPLDPTAPGSKISLSQPENIERRFGGLQRNCQIFVPERLLKEKTQNSIAKVTLLFCVESEINRFGLRTFFAKSPDRVLITIPGVEVNKRKGILKPWGIGITKDQISNLLIFAGASGIPFEVRVIACFSTGYRGMNGTINNRLISLDKVERLVFYDALYEGTEPTPPKGSSSNTRRAIDSVQDATKNKVDIIAYAVTGGGTPTRPSGRRLVSLPEYSAIDLIRKGNALQALIWARVLSNGAQDGFFTAGRIPLPIRNLIDAPLPKRGAVISSPRHVGLGPPDSVTLDDWATRNRINVEAASGHAQDILFLMCRHQLLGWTLLIGREAAGEPSDLECRRAKPGEALHDGFMQEFAWEFLAGSPWEWPGP